MRRRLRRWKTFNHHQKMIKKLKFAWWIYFPVESLSIHPSYVDTPCQCQSGCCNRRQTFWYKADKRKMRNGERKAIREFYKE